MVPVPWGSVRAVWPVVLVELACALPAGTALAPGLVQLPVRVARTALTKAARMWPGFPQPGCRRIGVQVLGPRRAVTVRLSLVPVTSMPARRQPPRLLPNTRTRSTGPCPARVRRAMRPRADSAVQASVRDSGPFPGERPRQDSAPRSRALQRHGTARVAASATGAQSTPAPSTEPHPRAIHSIRPRTTRPTAAVDQPNLPESAIPRMLARDRPDSMGSWVRRSRWLVRPVHAGPGATAVSTGPGSRRCRLRTRRLLPISPTMG